MVVMALACSIFVCLIQQADDPFDDIQSEVSQLLELLTGDG
jgi:hypothetical protein